MIQAIAGNLKAAALVPGLPHLLNPTINSGYQQLGQAATAIGDRWAAAGVQRLLYFSTQWISVLGHSLQVKSHVSGLHVDENWHDVADLPFAFTIDSACAQQLAKALQTQDYEVKLIDYEGFPVDTGTIVADRLINKGRFKTTMLSCCVYSDLLDTQRLFGVVKTVLAADPVPTAVVVVSGLSHRFFTIEIDPREDHIREPSDDQWNQKILQHMEQGRFADLEAILPDFVKSTKADMGFKAYHVLKGLGAAVSGRRSYTRAYAAIYGTGAAVVEF